MSKITIIPPLPKRRRRFVRTAEEIASRNALKLAAWFLKRKVKASTRRLAKIEGFGNADIVQDAMLFLLRYKPSREWAISTVVCNAVRWVLSRKIDRLKHCGRIATTHTEDLREIAVEYPPWVDDAIADAIRDAMRRLPERERDVIRQSFGLENLEPSTLTAIGKKLNLTAERVRQLQVFAIGKLAQPQLQRFVDFKAAEAASIPHREPPVEWRHRRNDYQAVLNCDRDRPWWRELKKDFVLREVDHGSVGLV